MTDKGHGFSARDGWFIDPQGRHAILRGVNLSGSSKVPYTPNGATHLGAEIEGWRDVSFIGRPFPLEEADEHLGRIAHWGFNVLRLLVTWEAIEHAGPRRYDEAYLDYAREVVKKAREHGLLVFIDPHHDVWSRWTGGDGAPFWCFEWAGLLPERFLDAQAVEVDAIDWPYNYNRVPIATMWTLFYGGDTFCPGLSGVQERLQSHYIDAICALAERLADLDNVLGYDTLNEPSGGYIGRGQDLAEPPPAVGGRGERPFSCLDYLAAADGHTITAANGAVLNPNGVSIWKDGCPWRKAGVWDVDGNGEPVLRSPEHFQQAGGRTATAWDFMVPFMQRFRDSLRRVHPGCFVFIEGAPRDINTPWDDPDPLVCNARHWYDVVTLSTRRFDPSAYRTFSGDVLSGVEQIAGEFTRQLAVMQSISRERMGNPPMLLGEFGIPYDMNDGEAYRTGDYGAQEIALDANYRALEALLLNSTQWNYTPDNTHEHGDQWNKEDLSIWSADDGRDPRDPDAGGRAVRAFCRPYVRWAAGRPLRMAFDPTSSVFEASIESDARAAGPTLVYAPRLHYPGGPQVEASSGTAFYDEATQMITWKGHSGTAELRLRRK
ncbi:MAG: cellulase family glycosylhydrolase [Dehalococcoidia bacterium]|nr:cellulase family glycosylhydrolase [Dehalococcoidia bacterium]